MIGDARSFAAIKLLAESLAEEFRVSASKPTQDAEIEIGLDLFIEFVSSLSPIAFFSLLSTPDMSYSTISESPGRPIADI